MRVYHDFFWYPDPDQRFLNRIRIRANDTDPTGSGSETLLLTFIYDEMPLYWGDKRFWLSAVIRLHTSS